MTRPFVAPAPEEVLADLGDLTDRLWRALEAANGTAVAFFYPNRNNDAATLEDSHRWDDSVHATLTRYFAISLLDGVGIQASEESGKLPGERIGLANNGICFRQGRYVIRVRKADDGRIPPTNSPAMEAFCAQQMSLPFNLLGIKDLQDPVNLIVLWGIDPENYSLKDLYLTCPRGAKDWYWNKPILHPALRIRRNTVVQPVADDDFSEIVPADVDANAVSVKE